MDTVWRWTRLADIAVYAYICSLIHESVQQLSMPSEYAGPMESQCLTPHGVGGPLPTWP